MSEQQKPEPRYPVVLAGRLIYYPQDTDTTSIMLFEAVSSVMTTAAIVELFTRHKFTLTAYTGPKTATPMPLWIRGTPTEAWDALPLAKPSVKPTRHPKGKKKTGK